MFFPSPFVPSLSLENYIPSIAVMATKKSRVSTRKPRDIPRKSSMDSRTDLRLIIQNNIIQFVRIIPSQGLQRLNIDRLPQMGRRFPEFCTLIAACRVSVRASPFAAGDDRVASYQAAINSVAGRHYTHWPFMVEVLNKWLEMNQDFVRDPLGHATSNSSPATGKSHSSTTSAQDAAALTSGHACTHGPSTEANDVTLPLSSDAEAPKYTDDSPPAISTTETKSNDFIDPPSCLNNGDVPVPVQKLVQFSWIRAFRFPPSLASLGIRNLASGNAFSSSRSWTATLMPPTTGWVGLSFLADSYKGWWEIFKKSFAFRSG